MWNPSAGPSCKISYKILPCCLLLLFVAGGQMFAQCRVRPQTIDVRLTNGCIAGVVLDCESAFESASRVDVETYRAGLEDNTRQSFQTDTEGRFHVPAKAGERLIVRCGDALCRVRVWERSAPQAAVDELRLVPSRGIVRGQDTLFGANPKTVLTIGVLGGAAIITAVAVSDDDSPASP